MPYCVVAIIAACLLERSESALECASDVPGSSLGNNLLQTHGSITSSSEGRRSAAEALVNCAEAEVVDLDNSRPAIQLKRRGTPARLIDTFAYADPSENQELLLRLEEMGPRVSEIHIVEGNRDFGGNPKAFNFQSLKDNTSKIASWRPKIRYHTVNIPDNVTGYALQEYQRRHMVNELLSKSKYGQNDIFLEGDLDEICSRRTLDILQHCEPVVGSWNAGIEMGFYVYSLAWRNGMWPLSTVITSADQLRAEVNATGDFRKLGSVSFLETGQRQSTRNWRKRPYTLRLKNGATTGWHVSFAMNGSAGIAHKVFNRVEGRPAWAEPYRTEAELARFIEQEFLADPRTYDRHVARSEDFAHQDLPQAVIDGPDQFPALLRSVPGYSAGASLPNDMQ